MESSETSEPSESSESSNQLAGMITCDHLRCGDSDDSDDSDNTDDLDNPDEALCKSWSHGSSDSGPASGWRATGILDLLRRIG